MLSFSVHFLDLLLFFFTIYLIPTLICFCFLLFLSRILLMKVFSVGVSVPLSFFFWWVLTWRVLLILIIILVVSLVLCRSLLMVRGCRVLILDSFLVSRRLSVIFLVLVAWLYACCVFIHSHFPPLFILNLFFQLLFTLLPSSFPLMPIRFFKSLPLTIFIILSFSSPLLLLFLVPQFSFPSQFLIFIFLLVLLALTIIYQLKILFPISMAP